MLRPRHGASTGQHLGHRPSPPSLPWPACRLHRVQRTALGTLQVPQLAPWETPTYPHIIIGFQPNHFNLIDVLVVAGIHRWMLFLLHIVRSVERALVDRWDRDLNKAVRSRGPNSVQQGCRCWRQSAQPQPRVAAKRWCKCPQCAAPDEQQRHHVRSHLRGVHSTAVPVARPANANVRVPRCKQPHQRHRCTRWVHGSGVPAARGVALPEDCA